MELREKIASEVRTYEAGFENPLEIADRILSIPEIDPTPTRHRILAVLGGLRDNMTTAQIRTVQWFADQFPA